MTLQQGVPSETFREACTPVLETARLVLRAPRLGDAKALAMLANDRRIAENTARIPFPYKLSDAKAFIDQVNRPGGELAFLITLADGTEMGACGLVAAERQPPELGYWLGIPHWGKGYATEAVRAVIDHAFTDLDHDALASSVRVTNPVSRRILEKCGFQWTGAGLCRVRALASSVPIDRFRLDRGIWASLKSWREMKRVA